MKKSIAVCLLVLYSVGSASGAFMGSSSGTFLTPTSTSSKAIYTIDNTGVNSSVFTSGNPGSLGSSNSLTFNSVSFSTVADTPFSVGKLIYYNGRTLADTNVDSVPIDVKLTFTEPAGLVEDFIFAFEFEMTPNTTKDPVLDADTLTPLNVYSTTNFTVGSDLYTLKLLGFSYDDGLTIVPYFTLPEDKTTYSDLYAEITAPVPVPSAILLGSIGMALAGWKLRKRKEL